MTARPELLFVSNGVALRSGSSENETIDGCTDGHTNTDARRRGKLLFRGEEKRGDATESADGRARMWLLAVMQQDKTERTQEHKPKPDDLDRRTDAESSVQSTQRGQTTQIPCRAHAAVSVVREGDRGTSGDAAARVWRRGMQRYERRRAAPLLWMEEGREDRWCVARKGVEDKRMVVGSWRGCRLVVW